MASDKKIITVRVSEEVKEQFEKRCRYVKRSMSQQAAMLIELYLRTQNKDETG